jgi:hypothetical protein
MLFLSGSNAGVAGVIDGFGQDRTVRSSQQLVQEKGVVSVWGALLLLLLFLPCQQQVFERKIAQLSEPVKNDGSRFRSVILFVTLDGPFCANGSDILALAIVSSYLGRGKDFARSGMLVVGFVVVDSQLAAPAQVVQEQRNDGQTVAESTRCPEVI